MPESRECSDEYGEKISALSGAHSSPRFLCRGRDRASHAVMIGTGLLGAFLLWKKKLSTPDGSWAILPFLTPIPVIPRIGGVGAGNGTASPGQSGGSQDRRGGNATVQPIGDCDACSDSIVHSYPFACGVTMVLCGCRALAGDSGRFYRRDWRLPPHCADLAHHTWMVGHCLVCNGRFSSGQQARDRRCVCSRKARPAASHHGGLVRIAFPIIGCFTWYVYRVFGNRCKLQDNKTDQDSK